MRATRSVFKELNNSLAREKRILTSMIGIAFVPVNGILALIATFLIVITVVPDKTTRETLTVIS